MSKQDYIYIFSYIDYIGVKTMIVARIIKNIIQYITEGFIEIFSPDNDHYPAVGVQPFGGTINHHNSSFDW